MMNKLLSGILTILFCIVCVALPYLAFEFTLSLGVGRLAAWTAGIFVFVFLVSIYGKIQRRKERREASKLPPRPDKVRLR